MACLLGLLGWLLQCRRQDRENDVGLRRLSQQAGLVWLDQNVGQARENFEMRVITSGDADAHVDTVFTPVDARRELGEL